LDLYDVAIPALNISGVTGSLSAEDFFATRKPEATAEFTGPTSVAEINLQTLKAGPIELRDIKGNLMSEQTDQGQRWSVDNLLASLYGGNATIDGSVLLTPERPFSIEASLANVDVDQLATDAFNAPDEATGKLSAYASVTGRAGNKEQFLQSIAGNGHFALLDGSVKRLAQLESGVQLLDIVHEGILGFNPTSLLTALGNFHSGSFSSFSGDAKIHDAIVDLSQVNFVGKEIRLRAEGDVELLTKNATFNVAGNIPRNANTILKGPLGAFLQHLSLANLINAVTFGLASHMPDIPILGKLGVDKKPRAFEFIATGNLDDPGTFTKSVLKTFHWLPNAPFATPHPVFGVGASPNAVPQ
jgi:hypothetical protein